jgi:hypothetical protein
MLRGVEAFLTGQEYWLSFSMHKLNKLGGSKQLPSAIISSRDASAIV